MEAKVPEEDPEEDIIPVTSVFYFKKSWSIWTLGPQLQNINFGDRFGVISARIGSDRFIILYYVYYHRKNGEKRNVKSLSQRDPY